MKYLKSFLLAIFLSMFVISSMSYARGKTPSVFDKPEEGLYYILVVNFSSSLQEFTVWSRNKKEILYHGILDIFPSKCSSVSIYLELGHYDISITNRRDIMTENPKDGGNTINKELILDQKYVDTAPGPLILEIYD